MRIKKQSLISFSSALSTVTIAGLVASPSAIVCAQNLALEEVMVTAQRRLESSQDTPVSITSLSADSIEKRSIKSFGDLIGDVPAIGGFEAPGSRGTVGINMRGVPGGSPANVSLDPAVAMYMDGVFIGKTAGSSLDVADIERIEILRGPQGTLYGRNSTAGAINLVTRRPTGEFGVRAKAGIGRFGERSYRGALDLPAIGIENQGLGQLRSSFAYQNRSRDGLYRNDSVGEPDFDEIDREAWRASLDWRVGDNFSASYIYDASRLDEHGALQQVVGFNPLDASGTPRIPALQAIQGGLDALSRVAGADPRIASELLPAFDSTISAYQAADRLGEGRRRHGQADNTPLTDSKNGGHALTLEWDAGELGALGDVTFKSISAHRKMKSYVFGDLEDFDTERGNVWNDLTLLTLGSLYFGSGGASSPVVDRLWEGVEEIGAFHSNQDTTTRYDQLSQELQMIGATENLDYTLGFYYFEDESRYRRNAVFAAPLSGLQRQNYDLETDAWSMYGQSTWRLPVLDRRLSLTTGLRYTEEKKSVFYNYLGTSSPFSPDFDPDDIRQVQPKLSRSEDFYNLSGTLTLSYAFTDDLNTFLRYATGYRSGGFNGELYDSAFNEEEIEQLELGLKSEWWERRLRVNASLYGYNVDDMQVSTISVNAQGSTSSSIRNAGKAKRWGGELEVLFAPAEDLVLGLNYAYISGEFDRYPPLLNPDGQGGFLEVPVLDKAKRSASPSNQVSLTADYTFARLPLGDITGFLQVNWQDEWYEVTLSTFTDSAGTTSVLPHQRMDERTVVNARLNLEQVQWGNGVLSVGLWGKNLTDDDYPTYGINFGSLGLIAQQYAEPRTYGVDVTFEY